MSWTASTPIYRRTADLTVPQLADRLFWAGLQLDEAARRLQRDGQTHAAMRTLCASGRLNERRNALLTGMRRPAAH